MKRGTEILCASNPIAFAMRRSSDGLWEDDGQILPWFWTKKDAPNKRSIKLGEYMYFFWWTGEMPFTFYRIKNWIKKNF